MDYIPLLKPFYNIPLGHNLKEFFLVFKWNNYSRDRQFGEGDAELPTGFSLRQYGHQALCHQVGR